MLLAPLIKIQDPIQRQSFKKENKQKSLTITLSSGSGTESSNSSSSSPIIISPSPQSKHASGIEKETFPPFANTAEGKETFSTWRGITEDKDGTGTDDTLDTSETKFDEEAAETISCFWSDKSETGKTGMTGTFVQRCKNILHNFYPDNVGGEGVEKHEECLSIITFNVFSFH